MLSRKFQDFSEIIYNIAMSTNRHSSTVIIRCLALRSCHPHSQFIISRRDKRSFLRMVLGCSDLCHYHVNPTLYVIPWHQRSLFLKSIQTARATSNCTVGDNVSANLLASIPSSLFPSLHLSFSPSLLPSLSVWYASLIFWNERPQESFVHPSIYKHQLIAFLQI